MSRLQISDQFGGERLETQARPVALTEQVAAPREDGRWKALADAFANGAGLADTLRQQKEVEDAEAAKRWAQSMTVSELGKAIKEGKMLPSQSPVFVGTAQHIWGVNSYEAGMRDLTSKLTTGELKFDSPEAADRYLTEWRNTTLSGASKYAVAGFDKSYAQSRDKVMDQVSKINDQKWVENASVQASDYLANSLNKVSSPDFTGTPQDAIAAVMKDYQLLRHTKTLPDAAGKQALADLGTRLATSGRKDLLSAFLDSDLEDIGSVRGMLGETRAATWQNNATAVYDGQQRKRIDDEVLAFYTQASAGQLSPTKFREWALSPQNKDYISASTIHSIEEANLAAHAHQQTEFERSQIAGAVAASNAAADRLIENAMMNGNLPIVMGTRKPQVYGSSGEVKDLSDRDVKERAEKIAVRRTAGMPFEQQVGFFAQNGLKNPNWEATINAGFFNLNTIGVDSKGKPTGVLNDAGKQAVELFKRLDTYGDYAKSLMTEKQYQRFSDIAFLNRMGRGVDDAVGIATAADAAAIEGSDVDKLVKKVHAQVGKIQADPFYKWDWAQRAWGDNTVANTVQMTSTLRRYATLLAHSGQYGDADSAIAEAARHLAHPSVSAKVNGTVYLRSELPTGPQSRTQEEWFERYISEVPKARARERGFSDNEVRLEFDPTISAYRGFVGVLPLQNADNSLLVVTKADIQDWYATQYKIDITQAAAKGAARVQDIRDTRASGERAAEWARNEMGKPRPPKAEAASPPVVPPSMAVFTDYWKTPEGQAEAARIREK